MSDILKFACKAPNCGRRFTTQEGLNTHFKLRHPDLAKAEASKPKIENTKDQVSVRYGLVRRPRSTDGWSFGDPNTYYNYDDSINLTLLN